MMPSWSRFRSHKPDSVKTEQSLVDEEEEMEYTTYILDGQTLVDNIHIIKQWVYDGHIRVHIPLCSVEFVEGLHQKSLEPKEQPKDDRQKRMSGRPRRDQPLFDINPAATKEFLGRAKDETGIAGVTFQIEGEEFTEWKEEERRAAKVEEKPLAPPSSFSEALLRKLNIKEPEKPENGPSKPKLVAKTSHGKLSTFKYHKIPTISRQSVPEALRPLFSCALWRTHEFENNPLAPDTYALLVEDLSVVATAQKVDLPAVLLPVLRKSISHKLVKEDHRAQFGELETDFPSAARREVKHSDTESKSPRIEEAQPKVNGHCNTYQEGAQVGEEIAPSVIRGSRQSEDNAQDDTSLLGPQAISPPTAQLRRSGSYAAAAESCSETPRNPVSRDQFNKAIAQPAKPQEQSNAPVYDLISQPEPHMEESNQTRSATTPEGTVSPPSDESDSDEDVVVFDPRARKAAQESHKKRRSTNVSRPVSRPMTAHGQPANVPTTNARSPAIESALKAQSPIFTPGQLYIASSPTPQPAALAYPTPNSLATSPARKKSPPYRATTASPQVQARQLSAPRHPRGAHNRPVSQDGVQRQGEVILQRQREAIRRQELKAQRATEQEADVANKGPTREVEMRPTRTPVVIDPDEFSRDYTIKANSHANERGRARGGRRGGRGGRGKQDTGKSQDAGKGHDGAKGHHATAANGDVDFVLTSGAPRGSARGRGKLWTP